MPHTEPVWQQSLFYSLRAQSELTQLKVPSTSNGSSQLPIASQKPISSRFYIVYSTPTT